MKQNEPSFLSLRDDEGRPVSCKIRGRVIFQKEFKKKAGDSRHKKQWGQRLRGMSKHDGLKGEHVTGQKKGCRESLTARATQAGETGRAAKATAEAQ